MIRLDKYLADCGFGARNTVKSLIRSGYVLVNDRAEKDPGRKIDTDNDTVTVNGEMAVYNEYEYYMLYKPAGIITASRDKTEKTVVDLIESKKRRDLSPVGRLDRDTEGLLLITNDGKLSHELLAPEKHVSKVYIARISGDLPDDAVEKFRTGIDIGDELPAKPAELKILRQDEKFTDTLWVEVTLTEGRYHEIKRMFESLSCRVEYLKRISMGSLVLDDSLHPGEFRPLTESEIASLKNKK